MKWQSTFALGIWNSVGHFYCFKDILFLSFIQHYFFWLQPWMEWLKACVFNYLINPWNNRWNNWILLNDMPTWECCLPRKWVLAVAKLDSWNASHIIWIYFTRETKSPHGILEKPKPPSEKKGKKKKTWMVNWRMLCAAKKVRPVASWSMTWLEVIHSFHAYPIKSAVNLP